MMSDRDDELLRQLGELARTEVRDERARGLVALVDGELSASEIEALEEHAVSDAASRARIEAYRPLSAGTRAQIAARLKEVVRERQPGSVVRLREDARDCQDAFAARAARALPRPIANTADLSCNAAPSSWRGPRPQRRLWAGLTLAAAVAALALLARPPESASDLPPYTIEVAGAPATLRGVNDRVVLEPVRLTDGTRLELVLRPAVSITEPVDARVFAIDRGGAATPWPAQVARSDAGALRLALALPPRPAGAIAAAAVLVGRSAAIATVNPSDEQLPAGVQRVTIAVAGDGRP